MRHLDVDHVENYEFMVQDELYRLRQILQVFLMRNLDHGLVLKTPYFWTSFGHIVVRKVS